ncbi:hypothetical protein MBCUT_18520 [Methanobrevibacter cuticularis]|uniref:Uncharacterized protein n=1 Tax=Methanobrevibacter cuticularis TaxID=47311 RepID=A0A166CVR7_9EURY|nr:hypothetical protein [Methanobrevibacter cuticularis]KZX14913.1 hypothetical protein MBCUT_18520 [Methanobrevibacter cuticularis]
MDFNKYFNDKLDINTNYLVFENNDLIDLADPSLAIFKGINSTDYFYPYNPAALNYSLFIIDKNSNKAKDDIRINVLYDENIDEIKYQYNLLKNILNKIKIKKKGIIHLTDDFLIYRIAKNELIPLNDKSKFNLLNVYNLISKTPETNKNAWKNLKISI